MAQRPNLKEKLLQSVYQNTCAKEGASDIENLINAGLLPAYSQSVWGPKTPSYGAFCPSTGGGGQTHRHFVSIYEYDNQSICLNSLS